MYENELYHFGVKGMKWGIRRKRKTINDQQTQSNNKDIKKTQPSKSRTVKDMSDDELRRAVNRLQLEQQYNKLNPEQISKGKKFVNKITNDILTTAAIEVGKNITKSLMNQAFKKAMANMAKKYT